MPPFTPVPNGAAMPDAGDAACTRILATGRVRAIRVPAVSGPNGCSIAFPVSLAAVLLDDGRAVEIQPPALMRCDLAETLAEWIREDIAPLGASRGELVGIDDAAAYDCRSRNHVPGARLSEHGRGDAIDVVALRFAGERVGLRQDDGHDLWAQVKVSACSRFMTVLGPGSDGYHEDNLHLDLENRHHGSHYCHWDHP
ncbi:MAG TPA: extensin family protein [Lichenihabitans sp.]|jgi:hypothetical protein|nr:extensin family protein [Lichenihabitans sp.]